MHIPSDGPLDYQTILAQRERDGEKKRVTVGGEGGRGWIKGVRKKEKRGKLAEMRGCENKSRRAKKRVIKEERM